MLNKAFTLVELLTVMAIISIVGFGSVSIAQRVIEQSKESKTEVVLRVLDAAMEVYRRDTGDYPVASDIYPALSELRPYLQIGYLYDVLNSNRKSAEILKNLPAECVSGLSYDWDDDVTSADSVRLVIFDGWYESDEPRITSPINLNYIDDPEGLQEPVIYRNRGNGIVPQIISAGKDRVFFTADDMVSTDL